MTRAAAMLARNKERADLNREASPNAHAGNPDYDELSWTDDIKPVLTRAERLAVYAEANPPADEAVAAHLKETLAVEIAHVTHLLGCEIKMTTRLALQKMLERLQKMHGHAVELMREDKAPAAAPRQSMLIAFITQARDMRGERVVSGTARPSFLAPAVVDVEREG